MTAKEAATAAEIANQIAVAKAKRDAAEKVKADEQFQINLRGKYAQEFVQKDVDKAIREAANKGLRHASASSSWRYFSDENGKTLVDAATKLLEADGYKVTVTSKFYPEYSQTGHFDEGDYSHPAYTSWIVEVQW